MCVHMYVCVCVYIYIYIYTVIVLVSTVAVTGIYYKKNSTTRPNINWIAYFE